MSNTAVVFAAFLSQFPRVSILAIALLCGSSSAQAMAQDVTAAASDDPAESSNFAKLPLGVVKEKPAEGFSVQVDIGYMVPYEATIPGTDVTFKMLPIPGGKFTMGSPEDEDDRRDDEGPQFEVVVEPFWMGQYEVTWAEYKKFMDLYETIQSLQRKGLRKVSPDNEIDGVTAPSPLWNTEYTFAEGNGSDEPAATMSQFAAKQYTKWLSRISGPFYRLPTESEWEYACRASTTTAFYFGEDADEIDDHAWNYENSDEYRQVVGELKPNPWGLFDMSGNVAEWTLDQYDPEGYTHVEAGSTVTADQAYRRPTELYPRVVRGGSFDLPPEDCRSAARLGSEKGWNSTDPNQPRSPWWIIDAPANGVGFRLIRPFNEPETMEARNEYWAADLELIMDNVKSRISSQGKGAYFTVDEKLVEEIQNLDKEK